MGMSTFQANDGLLTIYFQNIFVRIVGSNDCVDLQNISLRNQGSISPKLRMAE